MEGVELPNQVIIRKLEEKEAYKYLGNIGSWHYQTSGDERKIKKSISEEPENYTRQNSRKGTLSRDKYLGCLSRKILETILEVC